MGIRGLESFMEGSCPNGTRDVDIVTLAQEHRGRHPMYQPTIVVDGMGLINYIYDRIGEDWIFGGPWRKFIRILNEFIKCFEDNDIKLFFVFDGCVASTKTDVWVNRRLRSVKEITKIFDHLHRTKTVPAIRYQCASGTSYIFRFFVKYLTSCQIRTTVEEGDLEICQYAEKKPECFAILAQDTDFIIYDTRATYLSIKHFDETTMTTKAYDRDAFARHLGLDIEALPLFACLSGNDALSSEHLSDFHRSIGARGNAFASNATRISRLIRNSGWSGQSQDVDVIAQQARLDSGLLEEALLVYQLRSRLELQRPDYIEQDVWEMALQLHVNCESFPGMLQNLLDRQAFLRETIEDARYPCGYRYFRRLQLRVLYLLFNGDDSVEMELWCAYPGVNRIDPEIVHPEPLNIPGQIPTLRELWSGDSDSTLDIRWRTLMACLDCRLDIDSLKSLDTKRVVFCCTLHLMIDMLNDWEAVAFVAQAVSPMADNPEQVNNMREPCVSPRVVHLSTFFMVGVQMVTLAVSACGQPISMADTMPWNYFDGKLFHHLYRKLIDENKTVQTALDGNDGARKEFRLLWRIITSRTHLSHWDPLRQS